MYFVVDILDGVYVADVFDNVDALIDSAFVDILLV